MLYNKNDTLCFKKNYLGLKLHPLVSTTSFIRNFVVINANVHDREA
jgi:hypothetical protein